MYGNTELPICIIAHTQGVHCTNWIVINNEKTSSHMIFFSEVTKIDKLGVFTKKNFKNS